MRCQICKLNRGTHCGYSGGPVPGECGHGVPDVDKLVRELAARDAELAELRQKLNRSNETLELAINNGDAWRDSCRARDARIGVLTEALGFYADEENYEEHSSNTENGYECDDEGAIYHDWGEKARQALSGSGKESGK